MIKGVLHCISGSVCITVEIEEEKLLVNVDDKEGLASGKSYQDSPMKLIWKRGFIRLVLVGGIIWILLIVTALLFHAWSCQSSIAFFSGNCITCSCFLFLSHFTVAFYSAFVSSYF